MIVLKAIITQIPQQGDNIFKVRVPYMEDNTGTPMEFDALLCSEPNHYYQYKIDDCVFVTFEGEIMEKAIILGKLYVDIDESTPNYGVFNELKITGKATLPDSTTIGGYGVKDFKALWNRAADGGAPREYLKTASVASNTLTLTKQDDTTVTFTDTTYSAGTNINISTSNVISATDTKYTGGTNITIDENNQISVSGTVPNATNAEKTGVVLFNGALKGGESTNIDMSKYDYIEVYVQCWGVQIMYKIDLSTEYAWGGNQSAWQSTDKYRGGGTTMLYPSASSIEIHYSHSAVNEEKTTFYHRSIGFFKSFTSKTEKTGQSNYIVKKIVGYKTQ